MGSSARLLLIALDAMVDELRVKRTGDPANPSQLEGLIYLIRGKRVMLDWDLAGLYRVSTKRLNEQVRRNRDRFPEDFMFTLTMQEFRRVREVAPASSRSGHGGRRSLPRAFTEHGAIMAATVLKSHRAVEMSIFIVRAFVRLREMLSAHEQLMARVSELEKSMAASDENVAVLFEAIKQLMEEPIPARRRIGFRLDDD